MAHVRKQVRDAFKSTLASLTGLGGRVYASRVFPIKTLPAISISVAGEEVETLTLNGLQQRTLEVDVVAYAKASNSFEDALDVIGARVETALTADRTLGGKCHFIQLNATSIDADPSLEQPTGSLTMRYSAVTRSKDTTPEIIAI